MGRCGLGVASTHGRLSRSTGHAEMWPNLNAAIDHGSARDVTLDASL